MIVGIGQRRIYERRLALFTIGLDAHQRTSTCCILDRNGNQIKLKTIRAESVNPLSPLQTFVLGGPKTVEICLEASAEYPADLNGDSLVDGIDLTILLQARGPGDDPDACAADIVGDDGMVDGWDLIALLQQWGQCP